MTDDPEHPNDPPADGLPPVATPSLPGALSEQCPVLPLSWLFSNLADDWSPYLLHSRRPGQHSIQQYAAISKVVGEITALRLEVQNKALDLERARCAAADTTALVESLRAKLIELEAKERLKFILVGINEQGQDHVEHCTSLRDRFLTTTECESFVLAIDIRRSTELMLKARAPAQFARFITRLCKDLEDVVKSHFGVFDKFTGDGILSFFPDFFSGPEAGFRAVAAADEAHACFQRRYREFRGSFSSVLKNVGLGIGIDFGVTHLVQIAGGLTVVGAPVVYACRLSGAPAGTTLMNQPAYEQLVTRFSPYCYLEETEIDIKHEGPILAYQVRLNSQRFSPQPPNWPPRDAASPAT